MPTRDNRRVKHIVIAGIGVLADISSVDPRSGAKLIRATKEMLRDRHLAERRRRSILIAAAYNEYGKRVCEVMERRETGATVTYAAHMTGGFLARLIRLIGRGASSRRCCACDRTVCSDDVASTADVMDRTVIKAADTSPDACTVRGWRSDWIMRDSATRW